MLRYIKTMKKDFAEKLNRRVEGPKGRSGRGFHSASYHRHFEGYSEYESIDEKGRRFINRVYTGDYYSHDMEKKKRLLAILTLLVIWMAACAIAVIAAVQTGVGNNRWYVAMWQAGDVIGFAWSFSGLFNYLTNPRMMTVGDWRSSSLRLKRGSMVAASFLFATGVAVLFDWIISRENAGGHVLFALCFLLSGGLMLLQWYIEQKMPYKKTPSKKTAPEYASHIC